MKKILILSRRDDRPSYDRKESMLAGMAGSKNEYSGINFEDLIFHYDGKKLSVTDAISGKDIADFDTVFFIGWFKNKNLEDCARAASYYLKANKIPFANSEVTTGRSLRKLTQCVMAVLENVKVTPFIFCLDQTHLLTQADKHYQTYPYIAKDTGASRGHDNYLVTSHQQLVDIMAMPEEKPRAFILQEFIPNEGDYRIIVMANQVRLIIHRLSQSDSHLNNTSQGGKATLVPTEELPEKVRHDSVVMAQKLHREVSGIDMIKHKETGEFYFLEANNMPQLATGSFVAEKMAALDAYLSSL